MLTLLSTFSQCYLTRLLFLNFWRQEQWPLRELAGLALLYLFFPLKFYGVEGQCILYKAPLFVRLFFADSGQGSGEWHSSSRTCGLRGPQIQKWMTRGHVTNAGSTASRSMMLKPWAWGASRWEGAHGGNFWRWTWIRCWSRVESISRRESRNSKGSEAAKCGVRG